ncbi:MAG: hypothetical protein V8R48_12820 [Eggerthella lenta]
MLRNTPVVRFSNGDDASSRARVRNARLQSSAMANEGLARIAPSSSIAIAAKNSSRALGAPVR